MPALSGDVQVPGIGKFPKVAVYGGVGAVLVLIIWQNRKAKQAAAAQASTDPYPPDGSTGNPADPNSTDPSTGATYGDEAAGTLGAGGGTGSLPFGGSGGTSGTISSAGAYPWDGTYNNPNDPYSMDSSTGNTYGSEGYTGTGPGGGTAPSGPPFSTNAQWSQYVLDYFTQNQYSDISGRTDAIGLYIAGQPLTAQQATYIHDATAIGGNPPVSGPGNFPPSLRVSGTTSASGAPGQSPGLSVTPYKGYANFGWSGVTRALDYELLVTGAGGKGTGTSHIDRSVRGLNAEHVGLTPGHYTAKVRARNGSGDGPWSVTKTFTVAK